MILDRLRRHPIAFLRYRKPTLMLSVALFIASIIGFLTIGMNLGIDFRGGILIDAELNQQANISLLRARLNEAGLGEVALQQERGHNAVIIRIERQPGDEKQQQQAITKVQEILKTYVSEYRRIELVGPTIGKELSRDAALAILLALVLILAYIWFRFEWQFGLGAILALTHDVVLTVGFFVVTQIEFTLATVAALLTIAGYSINDTVIIYDRIRENLRLRTLARASQKNQESLIELCNRSLNETLSRTLMTSLTTLIAVTALALLGGSIVQSFALAMIWGVIVGTWSSVVLAVPLVLLIDPNANDEGDIPQRFLAPNADEIQRRRQPNPRKNPQKRKPAR